MLFIPNQYAQIRKQTTIIIHSYDQLGSLIEIGVFIKEVKIIKKDSQGKRLLERRRLSRGRNKVKSVQEVPTSARLESHGGTKKAT